MPTVYNCFKTPTSQMLHFDYRVASLVSQNSLPVKMSKPKAFSIGILLTLLSCVAHAQPLRSESAAIDAAFRKVQAKTPTPLQLVSARAHFYPKPTLPDWLALMTPQQNCRFLAAVNGKQYWVVHLRIKERSTSTVEPIEWGTSPIIDATTGNELTWQSSEFKEDKYSCPPPK